MEDKEIISLHRSQEPKALFGDQYGNVNGKNSGRLTNGCPKGYFPRTAKQMAQLQKACTQSRRRPTRLPALHVPYLFMLFHQEGGLQPQDTQKKEAKALANSLVDNVQRVK